MCQRAGLKHYWMIIIISIATAIGLNNILLLIDLAKYSEAYQKAAEILYSPSFAEQILVSGIVVPIIEELVFRGLLFKVLRKWVPFIWAMIVSALLFGVYHGNLVQFVYAGLCGLLLAYLCAKFASLDAPILAHMTMNLTAVVMTEYDVFEWIFESVVCVLAVTVLCVVVGSMMFVQIQKNAKNWMLQKC